MKLNTLSLKDKNIFSKFLTLRCHRLSAYAFENIYIWKKLFRIRWAIIEESLCIFFEDNLGCFLYLPPQAAAQNALVIEETFGIMDSFNKNTQVSRIENLETQDLDFFKAPGYSCEEKPFDYLCLRKDLVELRGERFKSKRACLNYFTKHYQFEYLSFSPGESKACLALYNDWMQGRAQKNEGHFYKGMLGDSLNCLEVLLKDYSGLDIRVVSLRYPVKSGVLLLVLN